jgi:DNA-binding protein HU-beta
MSAELQPASRPSSVYRQTARAKPKQSQKNAKRTRLCQVAAGLCRVSVGQTPRIALFFATRGAVQMAKAMTAKKKPLSKSAILEAVTETVGEEISRKHVKQVVETLVDVAHQELKKNGIFVLPGFAKFVVVKKPARPARVGINPFTKEKQKFAAKPASKGVKARPVKAIKDAVL